jgi:hypothetical protein
MATLVKALRSGDYTQGFGVLKQRMSPTLGGQVVHCCEGVACEIAGPAIGYYETPQVQLSGRVRFYFGRDTEVKSWAAMPQDVADYFGFESDSREVGRIVRMPEGKGLRGQPQYSPFFGTLSLPVVNDDFMLTFDQIADLIEWYYLSV